MGKPVQHSRGLRIATRCQTNDQFVSSFNRFCEDAVIFIPHAKRVVGTPTAFSFDLADGTSALCGVGTVLDEFTTADNRFGRPGIVLGLEQLTPTSQRVLEAMQIARALVESEKAERKTPAPMLARTMTSAIAVIDPTTLSAHGATPDDAVPARGPETRTPSKPIAARGVETRTPSQPIAAAPGMSRTPSRAITPIKVPAIVPPSRIADSSSQVVAAGTDSDASEVTAEPLPPMPTGTGPIVQSGGVPSLLEAPPEPPVEPPASVDDDWDAAPTSMSPELPEPAEAPGLPGAEPVAPDDERAAVSPEPAVESGPVWSADHVASYELPVEANPRWSADDAPAQPESSSPWPTGAPLPESPLAEPPVEPHPAWPRAQPMPMMASPDPRFQAPTSYPVWPGVTAQPGVTAPPASTRARRRTWLVRGAIGGGLVTAGIVIGVLIGIRVGSPPVTATPPVATTSPPTPAPITKPVAKTKLAPVAATKPAVAATRPAPVAATKPAPATSPAAITATKPAPVTSSAAITATKPAAAATKPAVAAAPAHPANTVKSRPVAKAPVRPATKKPVAKPKPAPAPCGLRCI